VAPPPDSAPLSGIDVEVVVDDPEDDDDAPTLMQAPSGENKLKPAPVVVEVIAPAKPQPQAAQPPAQAAGPQVHETKQMPSAPPAPVPTPPPTAPAVAQAAAATPQAKAAPTPAQAQAPQAQAPQAQAATPSAPTPIASSGGTMGTTEGVKVIVGGRESQPPSQDPVSFADTLMPPSSFIERTMMLPLGGAATSPQPPPAILAPAAGEALRSPGVAAPSGVGAGPGPSAAPAARSASPSPAHSPAAPATSAQAHAAAPQTSPNTARSPVVPTASVPKSPDSDPALAAKMERPDPRVEQEPIQAPKTGFAPILTPPPMVLERPLTNAAKLIGRMLAGKYMVESSIGRGATAEVFRAQHASLKRPVAVKVLHQENQAYVQFVKRFKAEAHTLSKLEHQNIARVIDFGQEPDGLLYLVMELLVGKSLEVLVEQNGHKLPVRQVLDVGIQTCNALAFAHDEGVIHRDVKPENVILVPHKDEDGKPCDLVKVCDFGLAKLRDPDPENADITMGGAVCGSPAYMSPEQILGEKLDARTDIYALAIMLYESLTGALPFEAMGLTQLFAKKLLEPPVPLRERMPDVDPRLDAAIMRGLARERDDRPKDARVLRQELRAVLATLPEAPAA
jgi:serine/threonine-protein kinase